MTVGTSPPVSVESLVEHEFWRRLGRSRFGSADLATVSAINFPMVRAMKNGFWKSIGKVPVLVLAVAVGPVALADGPTPESNPADGTAASVASPIPSTDPTASVSSPIRLISTDSILADPNCAPPAGPAAQSRRRRPRRATSGHPVASATAAAAVPRSNGPRISGATSASAFVPASTTSRATTSTTRTSSPSTKPVCSSPAKSRR